MPRPRATLAMSSSSGTKYMVQPILVTPRAYKTRVRRQALVDSLLRSDDPSIRWRVLVRVLDADPSSAEVIRLQETIRTSPRARALCAALAADRHVYAKW